VWGDAWAYDVATGPFKDDIPFWERLVAERRPRRVLELACGTGRLSFPVAHLGRQARSDFQFVGLDLSGSFLDRARARLTTSEASLNGSTRFVQGDMAPFDFGQRFDLIFLAYNSFAYLTDEEQRRSMLAAVSRHLEPGGVFAFDVATPNLMLLSEAQASIFPVLRHEIEWADPAPGVKRFVSVYKTTSYDAAEQTERTTHYWEIYLNDGRNQSRVNELAWHHFFPMELESLLREAGLTPVDKFGDYDGAPFCAASPHYVWLTGLK
jgi:SAM-dependent methyltransferase